jgi:hypothetical protein
MRRRCVRLEGILDPAVHTGRAFFTDRDFQRLAVVTIPNDRSKHVFAETEDDTRLLYDLPQAFKGQDPGTDGFTSFQKGA